MNRRKPCGFTLIETLVALVVLAVAYAGVVTALSQFVDQRWMIDQRNIAHRLAWNRLMQRYLWELALLREDATSRDQKEGTVTLGSNEWLWRVDARQNGEGSLTRHEIEIARPAGNRREPVRSLVIFLP